MYGTPIGIKVVNLKTLVVSRLLGKVENGERSRNLRYLQGASPRETRRVERSGKTIRYKAMEHR